MKNKTLRNFMQKLFQTLTICLLINTNAIHTMEKKKKPEFTGDQTAQFGVWLGSHFPLDIQKEFLTYLSNNADLTAFIARSVPRHSPISNELRKEIQQKIFTTIPPELKTKIFKFFNSQSTTK